MSDFTGLDRHADDTQGRRTRRARIRDVVGGDAGLSAGLLDHLGDGHRAAHQVSGGDDVHVLHRDSAVGESRESGLRGEIDRVELLCLPNFVIRMPRIKTSSEAMRILLDRLGS